MNHEIELKLRLNATELPLLEKILNSALFSREPTLKLLNRYFDTPDSGLSQSGAALRIRQQNELFDSGEIKHSQIIQTLKTRGTSAAGLHQRMEWDWSLAEVRLDLDLIKNSDAHKYLSSTCDLEAISPLFTTNFLRKVWMYEQGENSIELVVDQGHVSTEDSNIDLLELELELKHGEPKVLFDVAQKIANQCPVLMSDISKAERGYSLLKDNKTKDWVAKIPNINDQQSFLACLKAFFAFQLSVCQRSLEYGIWDLNETQKIHAQSHLESLHDLLSIISCIDNGPDITPLQLELKTLQQQDFSIDKSWGVFCLNCGYWLYTLIEDENSQEMTSAESQLMIEHAQKITAQLKLQNSDLVKDGNVSEGTNS